MADDINIKIAGDSTGGEKAVANLERRFDSLEAKLKSMRRTSKQLTDDGTAGFGKFATAAVGVSGVLTGINSVVSLASAGLNVLSRELDNLQSKQMAVARTQVTLGQAQRQMLLNLGQDPSLAPLQATAAITAMSGRTGVDENAVTRAASDLFSARGSMSAAKSLQYLETALALDPTGTTSSATAGGMMDLAKAFKLSPEQAAGMLMQTQNQSRTTSIGDLATNGIPNIIAMSKFGDSAERSMELVAALGQAGGDKSGAQSGTSAIQLAARLAEVLPGMGSTSERIQAVRNDKALQDQVFSKEFGEARYKPIIRELLTGGADSPVMQALTAAQQGITSPAIASTQFGQMMAQIGKLPVVQAETLDRTLGAASERLLASDISGGRTGIVRNRLFSEGGMLQASGISATYRDALQAQFEAASFAGVDPVEWARTRIANEAFRLENPMRNYVNGGIGGAVPLPGGKVTDEEREMARLLKEIAGELGKQTKLMDRNQRPAINPRGNVEGN